MLLFSQEAFSNNCRFGRFFFVVTKIKSSHIVDMLRLFIFHASQTRTGKRACETPKFLISQDSQKKYLFPLNSKDDSNGHKPIFTT